MKRKLTRLEEIGLALLLFIAIAIVSYYSFSDRRSEDEKQLDEMVEYQISQGRNARIENGFIIVL